MYRMGRIHGESNEFALQEQMKSNQTMFQELDYKRIYLNMMKPAYIFDGRKILNHDQLQRLGFIVQTIGKKLTTHEISRPWGSQPHV